MYTYAYRCVYTCREINAVRILRAGERSLFRMLRQSSVIPFIGFLLLFATYFICTPMYTYTHTYIYICTCREINAVRIVRAGDHSFFRMSRQIAPDSELMFGCHTRVVNFILGGTNGYSFGRLMST